MASLEIGQSNKSISYMNLSKTGTRYKNEDHGDECSIKHTFGSRPWLDKQSDWLVCITRFCVPLHSIPIIAAMPDAIQILALREDQNLALNFTFPPQNANRHDVWMNENDGKLMDLERPADQDGYRNMVADPENLLHSINLPASDTMYEFLRSVRDSLANIELEQINNTKASDVIRIVLGPNFKFSVLILGDWRTKIYLRLGESFFKMSQFLESLNPVNPDDHQPNHNMQVDLVGRRFLGISQTGAFGWTDENDQTWCIWESVMSCADTINRIKKLVFTSDLQVRSESDTQSSYRRFLVDYLIENPTKISYALKNKYYMPEPLEDDAVTISEEVPAHRIYTSSNASGGRWQSLISDAPLYELTVRCFAQVWNFEKNTMEQIPIPVNAGATFSAKLVFINKSDSQHKPDKHMV
jgi:hypothetical protein